jgi:hypothetical protein
VPTKPTTTVTTCPVCAKPLAGRGKCKSYIHEAIGFYAPGLILNDDGYGYSEVVSVEIGDHIWGGYRVTERDLTCQTPGRIRVHATAWRYDRRASKYAVAYFPEGV